MCAVLTRMPGARMPPQCIPVMRLRLNTLPKALHAQRCLQVGAVLPRMLGARMPPQCILVTRRCLNTLAKALHAQLVLHVGAVLTHMPGAQLALGGLCTVRKLQCLSQSTSNIELSNDAH